MGDALCGPSNALQNFQKHTAADRTLQQDRLISRQSPSQGFRSQNPSQGALDPEFAAFESNQHAGIPPPELQHGGHFVAPAPHMPISHPAEAQNWASDFQNLHISGPSQQIQNQPGPSAAPIAAPSQQGWHSEFMRQQQHTPGVQQNQAFGQRYQPSFAPSYGMSGQPMGAYASAPEATATKPLEAEAFDESAFEAAFEQAKADMASQFDTSAVETSTSELKSDINQPEEEMSTQSTAPETIRIGSDTIPQVDRNEAQVAMNDPDELARTAGQLLNSVSHETNQKFRESNFLELMRRIRDREVQIEGDEFRETAQSLHPGGKFYPEGQQPGLQEKRSWMPIGQDDFVHVAPTETNTESERLTSHLASDPFPRTPNAEPTNSSGSTDYDSLYASWNHGDRWA